MKYGLTQEEFAIVKRIAIDPLKEKGCAVWIFGSRARGDHRKFSDIDLLYSTPKSTGLPSGMIFSIKDQLEESRLSYKVDLVNSEDLASSYKENVLKDRIVL